MPLQWLGVLEARPSPFAQAVEALQPAAQSLAQWLAAAPEREQKMVDAFLTAYWKAPAEFREMMLNAPNAPKMVELINKYHPGTAVTNEQGKLEIMVPMEIIDQEADFQERQAARLLSRVFGMDEQDRLAWEMTPQGQELLKQAQPLAPHWFTTDEQTGALRLIPNIDQQLERTYKRAQIEALGAEAEERRAQAKVSEVTAKEVLPAQAKALEAEVEVKHATVKQIYAGIENSTMLAKEEAAKMRKEIEQMDQNMRILEQQAPHLLTKIKNEAELLAKEAWRIDQLTDADRQEVLARVNKLASETEAIVSERERAQELHEHTIANLDANTEQIRANTERMKTLLPLEASQLQTQIDLLQIQLKYLPEEKAAELAGLYAQIDKLVAETTQIKELTPELVKELQARVEDINAQVKERLTLLPLKAEQLAEETKLIIEQRKDIPAARALAERVAEANITDQEIGRTLQLVGLQLQDKWHTEDAALQRWITEQNLARDYYEIDKNYQIAKQNADTQRMLAVAQDRHNRAIEQIEAARNALEARRLTLGEKQYELEKRKLDQVEAAEKRDFTLKAADAARVMVDSVYGSIPTAEDIPKRMALMYHLTKTFAGDSFDEDAWIWYTAPSQPETEAGTQTTSTQPAGAPFKAAKVGMDIPKAWSTGWMLWFGLNQMLRPGNRK